MNTSYLPTKPIDITAFNMDNSQNLSAQVLSNTYEQILTELTDFIEIIEENELTKKHIEFISNKAEKNSRTLSQRELDLLFNGLNPYKFIMEIIESDSYTLESMVDKLKDKFNILAIALNDDGTTNFELAEHFEPVYNEMYPLYSKPSAKTIAHFINEEIKFAFLEIGDWNYFGVLTACGQDMSPEIGYMYLITNGSIPHNIASSTTYLGNTSDIIREALTGYFQIET